MLSASGAGWKPAVRNPLIGVRGGTQRGLWNGSGKDAASFATSTAVILRR